MAPLIAVDTNVLLRYLLRDDEAQAERACLLIGGTAAVLITDVVLAETVWTLTGRRYRASKSDIISVVEGLLSEPGIRFEDDEVVWRALQAYRDTDAGFSDALIVYKALKIAAAGKEVLEAVHTFDAAARQLPHTGPP